MNNKLIIPNNYINIKNTFKQKWKELTAENLEDLNLSKKQLIDKIVNLCSQKSAISI